MRKALAREACKLKDLYQVDMTKEDFFYHYFRYQS